MDAIIFSEMIQTLSFLQRDKYRRNKETKCLTTERNELN